MKVTVKGLNGLHQLGYSMDGTNSGGVPFFTAAGGGTAITAGNISLNAEILADPNKIATSLRTSDASGTETVIKGNNTLAILLANLKDTPMKSADGLRNATIGAQFSAIVGQLGYNPRKQHVRHPTRSS